MITEEQIWDYLDGKLTLADRQAFEQTLATDKQAAALFQQTSSLHHLLKAETLLAPSILFTDSVMGAIDFAPAYTPATQLSLKPLLVFILPSVLVIIAIAVYLIYGDVQISNDLPFSMPNLNFGTLKLYFVIADVLLAAYFVDAWLDHKSISTAPAQQ